MEPRSLKRVIIWIVISLAAIAAFAGAVFMLEKVLGEDDIDHDYEDDSIVLYLNDTEYEITHNIESYLLIGTDDSGNVKAKGKDYHGQMADFLLVYVMDKTANTHGYLQIDRNTMTDVPVMDSEGNGEGEEFEQICTANWYGANPDQGCDNTLYTVAMLLGEFPIDGYYSIHMSEIGKLNDAVDGVEVTLKDDFSDMDPEMTKGKTLTLNDEQAELFVRGRMDVGKGTNEERMERQKEYMDGFKKKAKVLIGEDQSFINDLWELLKEDAVTNVPESRLSVMANQIYKGEDLGILTIDGKTKLGKTLGDGKEHEEFYADEASIADAMVKLCGIDEAHIYKDTGEDE